MKVGISAFAGDAGKSGIGQYLINTISRLPTLAPNDQFVVFTSVSGRAALQLNRPGIDVVSVPDWVEKPVINILWHLLIFPLMLATRKCDIAYLPAGNRRLGWWYGVPSVGTVHDLSQLHVTAKYDGWRMFYVRTVLPRMMRRLTRIISVSEATRRDLRSHAMVSDSSLRVIPNGFDRQAFERITPATLSSSAPKPLGLDSPYLLYVARLEHPGKNHVGLLEAFALLKQKSYPHKLVFAGSPWSGSEVIEQEVQRLGLEEHVVFTGYVANEELPLLYANADLFVFPSLFEGFGIPLLEAMMAGLPICASNRSSIPEVLGDAGLLFEPDNPQDMAGSIQRILDHSELRAQLIGAGKTRVERFDWDVSARSVLEVFRECLPA